MEDLYFDCLYPKVMLLGLCLVTLRNWPCLILLMNAQKELAARVWLDTSLGECPHYY